MLLVNCNPLRLLGVSSNEQFSLVTDDFLTASEIPNSQFFYVALKEAYYTGERFDPLDVLMYAMDEGPGTDCKIPVDAESTEDLYCMMDIMEGDLWFHRIVLEYNVPEGMCDYLSRNVAWHFNQRVGQGPSTVYECTDHGSSSNLDSEGVPETETRYCLSACTRDYVRTGEPGSRQTHNFSTCPSNERAEDVNDFCGDLDKSETSLSNCCLGEYELRSGSSESGSFEYGEPTEAEWGGNLRECIGGLGRISWDTFNDSGEPIALVENALRAGVNETYEIPRLIEVYDGSGRRDIPQSSRRLGMTFITASHFTDVEKKNFGTNRPEFYRALTDTELGRNLRGVAYEGSPFLTYTCLDKSFEVKHRIHLVIREWNTHEQFARFKESKGGRGDPDVVGTEGEACKYYTAQDASIPNRETQCNDFLDVKDWFAPNINHGTRGRSSYNPYPEIIYQGSDGGGAR